MEEEKEKKNEEDERKEEKKKRSPKRFKSTQLLPNCATNPSSVAGQICKVLLVNSNDKLPSVRRAFHMPIRAMQNNNA